MTRFNANIIAMLLARFVDCPTVRDVDHDTLLRAYALFRACVPLTRHDAWEDFPDYVRMTPAQRTALWAGLFNRKSTNDTTRLGAKI